MMKVNLFIGKNCRGNIEKITQTAIPIIHSYKCPYYLLPFLIFIAKISMFLCNIIG